MTRINTNVISLTAQKTLARSNDQLQQALTRLSTGLRINSGKDDPAGLIASDNLGSDINATQKAISNTQRANQIIATADSSLGQVSSLLNDVRGLVTEAANKGAMSADQITANQLQVDASLSAIDRIAQTTSFQGRKLLDGSLEFNITQGAGYPTVKDLTVDSANLGATGSMAVGVTISQAAAKASLTNAGTAPAAAVGTINFGFGAEVVMGAVKLDIMVKDPAITDAPTVHLNGSAGGAVGASYSGGVLTVTFNTTGGAETQASAVADAINTTLGAQFGATTVADGDMAAHADVVMNESTITYTSGTVGKDGNDIKVRFTNDSNADGWDADTKTETIYINPATAAGVTLTALAGTIETALEADTGVTGWTVAGSSGAAGRTTVTTAPAAGSTDAQKSGNTYYTGGEQVDSLVMQFTGKDGAHVFSFDAGTSTAEVAAAINRSSDVTGIKATESAGTFTFTSAAYGSDAKVDIQVISEGPSKTFTTGLGSTTRAFGSDIKATVNGYKAEGKGNTLSINTSDLAMSMTVEDGSSTSVYLSVDGGGALFQLGPDVVSSQQARIQINSVNTAKLGGTSGRMYQLQSGGTANLTDHSELAASIVSEALTQVAALRGRLGAFQKATLESNEKTLTDTVENLTAAQSSIRDADFAAETANLTRAQILVQSGTAVLGIANKNPENVLGLLR